MRGVGGLKLRKGWGHWGGNERCQRTGAARARGEPQWRGFTDAEDKGVSRTRGLWKQAAAEGLEGGDETFKW